MTANVTFSQILVTFDKEIHPKANHLIYNQYAFRLDSNCDVQISYHFWGARHVPEFSSFVVSMCKLHEIWLSQDVDVIDFAHPLGV